MKVRRDNTLLIPFPDRVARPCLHSASANVSRHSPFTKMKIRNALALKRLLEIALAQFRAIHAHRIVADVQHTLHVGTFQYIKQFFYCPTFVPDREKVRILCGTSLVPKSLTLDASADGLRGKLQRSLVC